MISKKLKLFFATTAIVGCMSVSAFAAENKDEYKAQAAPITAEIEAINSQLQTLNNANKAVTTKYKAICAQRKANGSTSIDQDVWDKVKALHDEAAQYKVGKEEATTKAMRASVKESLAGGNYNGALDTLNQVLAKKQERLTKMQKTNEILQQIAALIGA